MRILGLISPSVLARGRRLSVSDAIYEVRCPVRGCRWSLTSNVANILEPGFEGHAERSHAGTP